MKGAAKVKELFKMKVVNGVFFILLSLLVSSCLKFNQDDSGNGVSIEPSGENKFSSLGDSIPLLHGSKSHFVSFSKVIRSNPQRYFVSIKSDTGEILYSGGSSGLIVKDDTNFPMELSYNKKFFVSIEDRDSKERKTKVFVGKNIKNNIVRL